MIGEKVGEVKGVRRGSVLRGELDIAAWIAFFFFFFSIILLFCWG